MIKEIGTNDVQDDCLNLIELEATDGVVLDVSGKKLKKFCEVISQHNVSELVLTPQISTALFNDYEVFHKSMTNNKNLHSYEIIYNHVPLAACHPILEKLMQLSDAVNCTSPFECTILGPCALHDLVTLYIKCDLTGANCDTISGN
ncbi:hypothetical protein [Candidatus Tisiphia endosymbiont of Nemotelus uliginosus]|uniref:hypothetical protein n=1 Tax=Candidatus Tisiphia endosymbiont of Nemotelus uliginosus TaxID=3077926 RepID=UPI0035C92BD7